MSRLLIIEGYDALPGESMSHYDALDELLPPDMGAFGQAAMLTRFLPSRDEVMQTAVAGGGMASAVIGGLAAETVLRERLRVPSGLLPFAHIGIGVIGGKLVSQWNPALGVGFAAGFAGLGIIRFLQSYLGVSVSLSGLDDSLSLADFGQDDADMLPAELQAIIEEEDDMAAIGVDDDMMGLGQVVATEEMASIAGMRLY